jgi:hypothetical protein
LRAAFRFFAVAGFGRAVLTAFRFLAFAITRSPSMHWFGLTLAARRRNGFKSGNTLHRVRHRSAGRPID